MWYTDRYNTLESDVQSYFRKRLAGSPASPQFGLIPMIPRRPLPSLPFHWFAWLANALPSLDDVETGRQMATVTPAQVHLNLVPADRREV